MDNNHHYLRPELTRFLDSSNSFEVRGMRILLEYFYANDIFKNFYSSDRIGISVFGSARLRPGDPSYETARTVGKELYENGFAVITGAASGVMEAANRGVSEGIIDMIAQTEEGRGKTPEAIRNTLTYKQEISLNSIGLKITLPHEKDVNPYLGDWVSFHYFAIRKLYFAMLSQGFVSLDGGWGTRDEFWEMCTLVQTGKSPLMPIISFSTENPHLKAEFERNIEQGFISKTDIHLVDFVESPEEVVLILKNFYSYVSAIKYTHTGEIDIQLKKPVTKKGRESMNNYLKMEPNIFGEVLFSDEKVVVRNTSLRSFGHLRRLIDALNGTVEY